MSFLYQFKKGNIKMEHVNLLPISEQSLSELFLEKDNGVYEFVEKKQMVSRGGIDIYEVIFKEEQRFFKFLAISYLQDKRTYTVPFEVFQEVVHSTTNYYSNWIKDNVVEGVN